MAQLTGDDWEGKNGAQAGHFHRCSLGSWSDRGVDLEDVIAGGFICTW